MSNTVQDNIGVLSPAEMKELVFDTSAPFSMKVIIQKTDSKDALKGIIHTCVDTPNLVCIGLDTVHRFTWTEIGIDTGIKSGDYDQVGRAGNMDFKQGHWADGIKAIVSRGAVLSQKTSTPTAVVIQQPQTVVEHSVSPWPFVIGFGVLGAIIFFAWRAQRKSAQRFQEAIDNAQREAAELASRNIKEQEWSDKLESSKKEKAAVFTASDAEELKNVRRRIESSQPAPRQIRRTVGPVLVRDESPSVIVVPTPVYMPPIYSPPILPEEDRPSHRRWQTPEPIRSSSYDSDSSSSSSSSWGSDSGGGGGGSFDSGGSDSGGGGGGDF